MKKFSKAFMSTTLLITYNSNNIRDGNNLKDINNLNINRNMKKIRTSFALLTTLLLMFNASNAQIRYELHCSKLLLETSHKIALKEVGTLELTNKNDGEVEKYLSIFNLKAGNPYCAAGQYYCFLLGTQQLKVAVDNIPITKSALCQNIFNDAKRRGKECKYIPQQHDLIIWKKVNTSKGHIERVHKVLEKGWVETIGFNTSKNVNGKKQEGVFLQKRNIKHPLGRLKIKGLVGFSYD